MEITKPNDIFVASLNNPEATTYDLMSMGLLPDNTSLFTKDEYKQSNYVQEKFKDKDGKFDDVAFNNEYNKVARQYNEMASSEYLENLDKIEYSPFDITRPKNAETFSVNLEFTKDFNPFKQLYSRTGINSMDENNFSMRELAQQGKVFDPETNTWSEESANDLNILNKFFGDTLVYAQWDEDGVHSNPQNGQVVQHKKGDWKINDDGNLYLEKLAGREIYGKQVVNPMDMLTTDGSFANKFDFMDSDEKEKSLPGVAFKLAAEIAPVLIPGAGVIYGGVRAAVSLASVMPTFYKSLEGLLVGDRKTAFTDTATNLEGWMAKFTQTSTSDEGSKSMFGAEQMANMVGDIFTQIYEQRAAASLSKLLVGKDKYVTETSKRLMTKIQGELLEDVKAGKITPDKFFELSQAAVSKIPELQSLIKKQSAVSKALSLGYMALTSTADIYGEALNSGYDRRTAGFAAMAAAAGQYGIMMNNKMGDWFLDQTTGYNAEVNRSLLKTSIKPYLDEANKIFNEFHKGPAEAKAKLAGVFGKMKNSMNDIFTGNRASIVEAMWKNSVVEGVEEVTEEAVLDMTKGLVDTMSYLGLTKKQGSFQTVDKFASKEGLQRYLANFMGGVLGGAMFEFERSVYSPWVNGNAITPMTRKSLYEVIADGHADELRNIVKKEAKNYGIRSLSSLDQDGNYLAADGKNISQADLIANKVIEIIDTVEGILHENNLLISDEDIIRKAIRDNITIENLKKTVPKDGSIGLEGIILQDFKNHMTKIVDLQTASKKFTGKEDEKQEADSVKEELKLHTDAINEILSGEKSMKYFDQITLALNDKINKAFTILDKDTYTRVHYGKNFSSLPNTGGGLTKERVTKEWLDSIEKRDLLKDLEYATAAYRGLEEQMNKPIADYVETRYDVEAKRTYEKIIDLKATINNFNTAGTFEEKEAALNRFIEINNELEALGKNKVTTWDVYNIDIYSQLKNLGLIKKVTHDLDTDGKLTEDVSDFSEEELKTLDETNGNTTEQFNQNIVTNYFKRFPLNPLTAEVTIAKFNNGVAANNKVTISKIIELENKPEKTPEDLKQIEDLKKQIINVRINSIENTEAIQKLRKEAFDKIEAEKVNSGITDDMIKEYEKVNNNPDAYEKSFNTIINDIVNVDNTVPTQSIEDWTSLNFEQLGKLFQVLTDSGILETLYEKLKGAGNTREEVESLITTLSTGAETDLSELQKELIKTILGFAKTEIDSGNLIKDSEKIQDFLDFENAENESVNNSVEKIKPEILKIHNYALDLLLKAIEEGSVDAEIFNSAKKLFQEELESLKASLFGGFSDLTNEEIIDIIKNNEQYLKELEEMNNDLSMTGENESTLEELIGVREKSTWSDMEKLLMTMFDNKMTLEKAYEVFATMVSNIENNKEKFIRVNKFLEMQEKGIGFKNNPLYDFIRNFTVSLNSDPSGKVMKLIDILEREDTSLKASSNISSYTSDDIREQDVNQMISTLEMMKAVVYGMSTTTVGYDDPVGFIKARQDFAKKNKIKDDVSKLKTVTSDVATLMTNDLDRLLTKLNFLKELTRKNAGRLRSEQDLIRSKMNTILLSEWKIMISKLNPSFFPIESLSKILSSNDSNEKKLLDIEDAIFEASKKNKEAAFEEILKHINGVDSSKYTIMDSTMKEGDITAYDLAIYYATVVTSKASDFHARSLISLSGDYNKAPFYTQELAARIVKASTTDPKVFSRLYAIKEHHNESGDFITAILGSAGTGKTSAVIGLIIDHFRQTNDMTNIWLSAPSTDQAKNLEVGVIGTVGTSKLNTETFDKDVLYEKLGVKSMMSTVLKELRDPGNKNNKFIYTENNEIKVKLPEGWESEVNLNNIPNLLIFDEATHLSFAEIHILNEISRLSYNDNTKTFMKVIMAGDTTQMGYLVEMEVGNKDGAPVYSYYEYNINVVDTINTPRLTTSVRAANNQKRTNTDTYGALVNKVTKMYTEPGITGEQANQKAIEFLKDTNTITGLANFKSKTEIFGDFISNGYNREYLAIIADNIKKDPDKKIGILTKNNTIDEDLNKILSDLGLINGDGTHPNIILFNEGNVQGREVDYFIFDSKFVTKYNKTRDKIKAFYTFMTRSKIASLIIDKEGDLKNQLNIKNAAPSMYPLVYDPLTKEETAKAKNDRIKALEDLLGKDPKITDNFKWKTGTTQAANDIDITVTTSIEVEPFDNTTQETLDKEIENDNTKEKEKTAQSIKSLNLQAAEFKYMIHGFYNNVNADINDNRTSITPSGTLPTDLNLNEEIKGKEEVKKVIDSWALLKNHLLHNVGKEFINSNDYEDYLKHVFKGVQAENINVTYVLTGATYNKKYNKPFAKENEDEDAELNDGEPFINLSAKLEYDGTYHYVTLATFAKEDKIVENIEKNVTSGDKVTLISNVRNKFNQIKEALVQRPNEVLELSPISNDIVEFITSTRLVKVEEPTQNGVRRKFYKLSDLSTKFPGARVSKIKFYPNETGAFRTLMRQYTYGEERSEQVLFGSDGKGGLFKLLKNKPYVVISYDNDLDGSISGQTTKAKLVPIASLSRRVDKVKLEVAELRKQFKDSVHEELKDKELDADEMREALANSGKIKELTAKAETLLNRSQILDVLIKWATETDGDGNPLIDLLEKPIRFESASGVVKEWSPIDVFNTFRGDTITSKKFKEIVDIVKDVAKTTKDISKIKDEVIKRSKGITGWHWDFYNIFAFDAIVNGKQVADENKLIKEGILDEEGIFGNEGYNTLKSIISSLMQKLQTIPFYYSIPIKSAGGEIIANSIISGESGGFKAENYANKFYISVAPESERLLVNLTDFFKSPTLDFKTEEQQDPKKTEEELTKEAVDKAALDIDNALYLFTGKKTTLNFLEETLQEVTKVYTNFAYGMTSDQADLLTSKLQKLLDIIQFEKEELKQKNAPVDIFLKNTEYNGVNVFGSDYNGVPLIKKLIELLEDPAISGITKNLKAIIAEFNNIDPTLYPTKLDYINAFFGSAGLNVISRTGEIDLSSLLNAFMEGQHKVVELGTFRQEIGKIAKEIINNLKQCN